MGNFPPLLIRFPASSHCMVLGDVDRVRRSGRRVSLRFPRQSAAVHPDLAGDLCFRASHPKTVLNEETLVARDVFVRHDEGGGGNRGATAPSAFRRR